MGQVLRARWFRAALAIAVVGATLGVLTSPSEAITGLQVSISATETSVVVGETIHLTITLTNSTVDPLTDVEVFDADAPDCAGPVGSISASDSATVTCT